MTKFAKALYIVSIVLVAISVLSFGIYSFLDEDVVKSESENRNLATFPEFSVEALLSGKFTSELEEYYSDQFPFRDFFISADKFRETAYAAVKVGEDDLVILEGGNNAGGGAGENLLPEEDTATSSESSSSIDNLSDMDSLSSAPSAPSSSVNTTVSKAPVSSAATAPPKNEDGVKNGLVLLKGTRAMELYGNSFTAFERYANTINQLKSALPDKTVYSMLIPSSVEFYSPDAYHVPENKNQKIGIKYAYDRMQNVLAINAYDSLYQHKDEYTYFRTDHHWTGLGAYYAYREFAKIAGFIPVDKQNLTYGRIDGFVGSLNRYVGSNILKNNPDYLEYYMPSTVCDATVYSNAAMTGGRKVPVIASKVSSSNKYLAFLSGDHAMICVTTSASTDRSIVVIKDSFGNALVPWLCNHYKTIYVVDPRRVQMNLPQFVNERGINEVLCINYTFIPTNPAYMNGFNNLLK